MGSPAGAHAQERITDTFSDPKDREPPPGGAAGTTGEPNGENGRRAPPDTDILPEKPSSGWAALPVATYSPETTLGVGAFASHFFRIGDSPPESRPSSMTVVGLYTLRDQVIVELIPELYWDRERWHAWSRLDYRRYPNYLWAVGNDAPDSTRETYQEDRWRWQFRIGHDLGDRIFLYGKLELQSVEFEALEPDGLLAGGVLPGTAGGRTVTLGPSLAWDTRDHRLVPHDGFYHEVTLTTSQPTLGSEYGFNSLVVNLRRYLPISATTTLALQYYAELQQGDVPFFKLAQIGGQSLLRGYFEGRFRDKTLMAAQAEYRFPIIWRFGGVVHAAVGDVAAGLPQFALDLPEWTVGTGLRICLNTAEKLNLRADVGVGYDTWGFYVGVAESF
ncbi:MAG: BamA/TamA family outer membrane protein [Myxococcales bacterium]